MFLSATARAILLFRKVIGVVIILLLIVFVGWLIAFVFMIVFSGLIIVGAILRVVVVGN